MWGSVRKCLSIIRNKIGCDTGSIPGTNTNSPNKQATYSFTSDDDSQVWFSKQAMSYGVDTIYANAWSAPVYMKQRYVEIIVQYLTYYKAAGIPISHVCFLNEGDGSDFKLSTAEQTADVIPLLYNELKSQGLSDIKMTCCDNIGWKSQMEYTEKLAELDVEKYLGVVTSHQYSSDPETPINTTLPTWMTEGAANDHTFATAWYSNGGSNEGFTWAVKIAQGIVNAELSAYIYWEGLETNNNGSLSHMIDTDGTNFSISSILWAMAHWSRHIRPGVHRLSTNGVVQDTIVGAFENVDGSIVMVLTNSGTAAQTVDLSVPEGSFSTAQAFTSDAESQMVDTQVTLSNGAVKVTVPVHGVVTAKLTTGKSSASVSTTIPSMSTQSATSENQASVYQTVSATTLSVVRASTYAQSTGVAVSAKAVNDTASTAPAASTGLSKSLEGDTTKKSVYRPQKTHGTAHHRGGRRGSRHHGRCH
ncbi:hypothetical protein FANTH_11623 [Fusarium anthophilum]|uniref:Glycosyl hydrolase family 30 beta sandwich domain-containing protein n=1 Tax=Fusarium anthophilum TaxID=48485 RepID=A0A8H4YWR1_9HYPO|nr:hypothetical protein FANTH_11623 [Fusarium anthophilum]